MRTLFEKRGRTGGASRPEIESYTNTARELGDHPLLRAFGDLMKRFDDGEISSAEFSAQLRQRAAYMTLPPGQQAQPGGVFAPTIEATPESRAVGEIIKRYLPVLDSIDRSLKNRQGTIPGTGE